MPVMKDYKVLVKPRSPCGTPWRSDTLTGHIACLIAWRDGPNAVAKSIELFRRGEPPFVLSDGFPEGLLPMPALPPKILTEYSTEPSEMKKLKRAKYISLRQFKQFRRGENLTGEFPSDPWVTAEVMHAAISRLTYTTGDEAGNLFQTYDAFLPPSVNLVVYARVAEGWEDKLHSLFDDLAKSGYGRDASVGLGAFSVEAFEPFDAFTPNSDENSFMSLSTFCPADSDPTEGYYKIEVKYGKLNFVPYSAQNPFKKPIVQILPGAVFWAKEGIKPFYGRVVEEIAPGFSLAVQFCYCLPVPVKTVWG